MSKNNLRGITLVTGPIYIWGIHSFTLIIFWTYQDPILWAWLEIFFHHYRRGTNSKTTHVHHLLSHGGGDVTSPVTWRCFSAQYSERYRENSRCGPFEAKHPMKYRNCFFKVAHTKKYGDVHGKFHVLKNTRFTTLEHLLKTI